jgi:hypothetical protein
MRPAQVPHIGFPEVPNSLKAGNCISITNPIQSQTVTISLKNGQTKKISKERKRVDRTKGKACHSVTGYKGDCLLKIGVRKISGLSL